MSDTPQPAPPANAICWGCGYSLHQLASNRCPECGREFDPTDLKSMNLGRRPGIIARFFLRRTGWLPTIALLLAMVAMLTASRWPIGSRILAPFDLLYYFSSIHIRPKLLSYTDWAYTGSLLAMVSVILWLIFQRFTRAILRRIYRPPAAPPPVHLGRRMMLGTIAILAMGGAVMVSWPYRIARIWIRQIIGMPRALAGAHSSQSLPPPPIALTADQLSLVLRTAILSLPTSTERIAALKLLVQDYSERGLALITEAVDLEPDPQVRKTEIQLVALYANPRSFDDLMRWWDDPNGEVRAAVTDAFGILVQSGLPAETRFNGLTQIATTPTIDVGWEPLAAVDDPNVRVWRYQNNDPLSKEILGKLELIRPRIQQRMLQGETRIEREAAARAFVTWQHNYKLRVAEWGVWIYANGKLTLVQSIIDEIPPFVHRTGDSYSSLVNRVQVLSPMFVTKPILHFSSDRPMAVDVQVTITEGRPWFAFPQPDDFTLTAENRVSYRAYPVSIPTLDQLDNANIAPLKNAREGYPWLNPPHRSVVLGESNMMTLGQITSLGLRWQSVIVSPDRLAWMTPPIVPSDKKFDWWNRLREVPCAWVSSRGECERFLYYDGPTTSLPPIEITLNGTVLSVGIPKREARVALGAPARSFEPITQTREYASIRSGVFLRVDKSGRCGGCTIKATGSVDISKHTMLKSESIISAFAGLLTDAGLTAAEAAGLVDCWRPQFFQTPGSRFVLLMTAADYDLLCPIRIDPPPTELVRVGLVLTEFGVA